MLFAPGEGESLNTDIYYNYKINYHVPQSKRCVKEVRNFTSYHCHH